jgi:hypothetical protein
MYLVAIAWMYVVLMMAIAEATSSTGTVLGALFTTLLYGVLPLGIVMYLMGTPMRARARRAAARQPDSPVAQAPPPDGDDSRAVDTEAPAAAQASGERRPD